MLRAGFVLIAVVATALLVATPSDAAPRCGGDAARQLERRLPVHAYTPEGRRLGETLCFDFTGDGRKDIVFTGWEAMNHGAHYWAAFRATSRSWVRVKYKRGCCRADPRFGMGIHIHRGGRTIIVRHPRYEPDDPACCPTGGTAEGRWRWQGGELTLVRTATRSGE